MALRYWDDLTESELLDCRTIGLSQAEIIAFARRYDPQLFHIDVQAAATTRFRAMNQRGDIVIASGLSYMIASHD